MAKKQRKTSLLSVEKETSYTEQYAEGKALRDKCPRQSHAGGSPPKADMIR